ncbi:MAG TPA: phosphoribosylanthranilate isomerase [Terriglobales bacterium]|nr:phosphoribosylanthranilate isomerase [Terriglobales bacterium]
MTWVKICGTTTLEDAQLAVEAGANAIGFVFAASPRRVSPEQVRTIVKELPESVEKIGIFVNETAEHIRTIIKATGLTGVQLHGHESEHLQAEVNAMQTVWGRKPKLYRALHLPESFAGEMNVGFSWPEGDARPDALLLDTVSAGVRGGTGKKFDWQAAVPLVEAVQTQIPVIIAGGLNPENVGGAIRLFQPFGVDVVSGIEASPGKKDPEKLREFARAVKRATVMV